MQLQNQIALVTGGGSGMGRATAETLAQAGMRVAVLDRSAEAAQQVAQAIGGLALVADVANDSAVEQALAECQKQLGVPRLVVNCAGVATAGRIVGKEGALPMASFRTVLDINLMGSFNVLRLAAAAMSVAPPLDDAGERGVIINTASIAAYEGQVGQAAYAASKGALVALTLPAARELARFGIRVMCIAPGLIETPLFAGLSPAAVEGLTQATVFPKRLGKAAEYAQLVLSIAANPLLNGSVIRLDGAVRLA